MGKDNFRGDKESNVSLYPNINKMREYRITKGSLWYHVYRKKELEDWTMRMERLQRDAYTLNKDFARTFYHLDDAVSALTVAKCRWDKDKTGLNSSIEKKESTKKSEKTYWGEL